MASSSPSMPTYVYVIMRLRVSPTADPVSGGLLCHNGVSDDVYPIGGLVEPDDTLIGRDICHCRHLVNHCVKPNDRLYLTKVLGGFMNHEPS